VNLVDGVWYRRLVQVRAAQLRHLSNARSVTNERLDGVEVVVTGLHSNDLNGVLSSAADATGPAVARAVRVMARHGVPATWLVTDDAVPLQAHPALIEAGWRPELTGWVRGAPTCEVLAGLVGSARPTVQPEPVRTSRHFHEWLDVAAAVWTADLDPRGRAGRARLAEELGLSPGAAVQHWVARDGGGAAVGNASAFLAPEVGVVLVEHLNTVPAARRRGVARGLLRAVLEEAQRRGCPEVVLEPSPDGVPLYDAVGLRAEQAQVPREYYLSS